LTFAIRMHATQELLKTVSNAANADAFFLEKRVEHVEQMDYAFADHVRQQIAQFI
jgi:hypothetical protein